MYKKQITIPFHLSDPAGILFFGNVFSLAHEVYEQWIIQKLGKWEKWFGNGQWVAPIRKAEAEYFKPLSAGDAIEVVISIKSVGQTSFVIIAEFNRAAVCHARVETVQVFCDRKTFIKIPIPPIAKQLLDL